MSSDHGGNAAASNAPPSANDAVYVVPSSRPVYGDAYVTHFTLVLRTVARERADFRRLYSPRELALAEHFLDRLSPLEQHVYARLFQRKGPWFKTASLLSYFMRRPWKPVQDTENVPKSENPEDPEDLEATRTLPVELEDQEPDVESVLGVLPEVADHRQVQTTIQTLVNAGLLHTPTLLSPAFMSSQEQDTQLLVALEAIQQSATSAEMTALWKKLSGGKTKLPNGNNSGGNRASGSSSSSPLRPTQNTNASTEKCSSNDNNGTAGGTGKAEIFQAIKRLVMTQRRVDGSRIPVAKIMHTIWLDSYPLLQQRNSKDDIILVVRISDAARELFSRMHRLFYFQAAMPSSSSPVSMPASARVKTFQQIINERSGASRSGLDALTYAGGSSSQTWPGLLVIFKKIQYPSYEINIQHPIFRSPETYICYEIASRLHRMVNGLELEMTLPQVTKEDDILPPDWVLSDDLFENLPELTGFQRLVLPPDSTGVADEWQGRACGQFEKLLSEWTTLDDLVLEVRKCLRAYSQFHTQAAASMDGELENRPIFFIKCNAGYHLSRVLHHASALYEKQRQYARAVVVLRDLLAAPVFLVRKRSYWYERLALNCEHLKQHGEAKTVCEQAFCDADVLGAGLLAIQRRHERLSRRKDLQPAAVITVTAVDEATTKLKSVDPDVDDFIDLVSSDEDVTTASQETCKPVMVQQRMDHKQKNVEDETTVTPTAGTYPQHFIIGRPLNKSTGEKSRFIGYDDEPCDVEQLVLQYYNTQTDEPHTSGAGWYGVHCEGRVLINLFGLFMWDVLYAPVPDVFQSAYQAAPLDFGFAKVFYDARRDQIDKLVDDIEHNMTMTEVVSKLESSWCAHEGETTRFVGWGGSLSLRYHQLVVAAMGQSSLAKLLRHMATSEEFHRAQNGLPDLLLIRVSVEKDTQVQGEFTKFMDARHPQSLDVYKYCEMMYSMNLNGESSGRRQPNSSTGDKQGKEALAAAVHDDDATLVDKNMVDVYQIVRDDAPWRLELKLVEVKGPRDRLSDQQVRWLQLFNDDMGIDASVMHVVEEEKDLQKRQERLKASSKTKKTVGSEIAGPAKKRSRRA